MSSPFLATITLLGGGGAQPKGAHTHLAMITPLSGDRPGHDLPGWSPPVDPGYGIEGGGIGGGGDHPWWIGGRPPRPDGGLPVDPVRPDNSLPPGGSPVPPEISNGLPPPAGDYGNQVIFAVYVPGHGWTAKAYTPPTPKA